MAWPWRKVAGWWDRFLIWQEHNRYVDENRDKSKDWPPLGWP